MKNSVKAKAQVCEVTFLLQFMGENGFMLIGCLTRVSAAGEAEGDRSTRL